MLVLLLAGWSRSAPSQPGSAVGPLNLARSFALAGEVVALALDRPAGPLCGEARGNWDRKTAPFVTNIRLNGVPAREGNYLTAFAPPMGDPRNASPFTLTVAGAGTLTFRYKTSLDAGNDSELIAYLDGDSPLCLWQASGCWTEADYSDDPESWWDTAALVLGGERYTRQIRFVITGPRRAGYEEWQPGAGKTLHRAVWLDHFVWTPAPDMASLVQFSPAPPAAGLALPLPQNLTLSSPYAGVSLHYTLNGQTPTAQSPVYTAPIPLDRSLTVKVIVLDKGQTTDGKVYSAAYALSPPAPAIEPNLEFHVGQAQLTFGPQSPGIMFFHTSDDSSPTHSGSVPTGTTRQGTGLTLTRNGTVRVLAWAPGLSDSPVTSRLVRVRAEPPVINPAGALFAGPTDFSFSSPTPGVSLHYTLDGQSPTPASATGSGCRVSRTGTLLQVIAVKDGMEPSTVSSRNVTLRLPPPQISLRIDGSEAAPPPASPVYFDTEAEIALSAPDDAALFYTLLPGESPQYPYEGPITVAESGQLSCASRLDGFADSETVVLQLQQRPLLALPEFAAGWNLFALPGDISPENAAYLLQALTPFAFTENFSGYTLASTLEFGQGYWVFRPVAGTFVPDRPIRYTPRHDTPQRPGWHWQLSGAPFPSARPVWPWQNGLFRPADPDHPPPVAGWVLCN